MQMLKAVWKSVSYNYKLGLFLILLFGIPRFILVLEANASGGGYGLVSFIFILMWFTPLILLTKDGRRNIGIRKPTNSIWLLYSFLIGALFCLLMYVLAKLLFGDTINNSFVYISRSYTVPLDVLSTNRLTMFLMFSLVGMTFSPIGEEILYRGVVHGTFVPRFGENVASVFDSLAFALTHLAHFGIVYNLGGWHFLPLPSLFWVLGMFVACRLFFLCKQKTDSILGAIVAHAGYNVGMMYVIFYHIL